MMTPAKRAAMDGAMWRLPLAAVCFGTFVGFLLFELSLDRESVGALTSSMSALAILLSLFVGVYQAFRGIGALREALEATSPKPPIEYTDWHHSLILRTSGRSSQTFEDARIPREEAPLPLVRGFLLELLLLLAVVMGLHLLTALVDGGRRAGDPWEGLYVGAMFGYILAQASRVDRIIRAAIRLALGMIREDPHVHLSVEPVRPGDTVHVSYIPNRHFPVASVTMRVVCLEMLVTNNQYPVALTPASRKKEASKEEEEDKEGTALPIYSEEIAKVENAQASGHVPLLEGNVTIPGDAMHTFQLPGGQSEAADKSPRIVWGIEVLLKRAGKKERREFHAFRVL